MIAGPVATPGHLLPVMFTDGAEPRYFTELELGSTFGAKPDMGTVFIVFDQEGRGVQTVGDPAPFLPPPLKPGEQRRVG